MMLEPSPIGKRLRFAKPKPEIVLQNKFQALETNYADPERLLKGLRVFNLSDFMKASAKQSNTKAEAKVKISEVHRGHHEDYDAVAVEPPCASSCGCKGACDENI